jgi:hypothetical protein
LAAGSASAGRWRERRGRARALEIAARETMEEAPSAEALTRVTVLVQSTIAALEDAVG